MLGKFIFNMGDKTDIDHHEDNHKEDINIALAILKERLRVQGQEISELRSSLSRIEQKLDEKFITSEQFKPIKLIVYGFVGMVVTAVVGALITLVMKGH